MSGPARRVNGAPDMHHETLLRSTSHAPSPSFVRHAATLRRLARGIVRGRTHDADDLAQDVALALVHTSADIDAVAVPEAYLRVALRRAAARRGRSDERCGALDGETETWPDDAPSPEETTSARLDARRFVARLREALGPRDAEALTLFIEEGLTAEEAAVALACSQNGVHQMRHRIVKRARELRAEEELAARA